MTADELARILDELGQRLGPTGEYVFALAVRQVYIDALIGLGVFAALLVIGLVAFRPIYRWAEDGNSYGDRGIVAILAGVFWALAVLMTGLNALFFDGLPSLLNPEYAALRDLLGTIR